MFRLRGKLEVLLLGPSTISISHPKKPGCEVRFIKKEAKGSMLSLCLSFFIIAEMGAVLVTQRMKCYLEVSFSFPTMKTLPSQHFLSEIHAAFSTLPKENL